MIIHHMIDGSIRDNIDGIYIPKRFENIYKLVNKINKENRNEDDSKIKTIKK